MISRFPSASSTPNPSAVSNGHEPLRGLRLHPAFQPFAKPILVLSLLLVPIAAFAQASPFQTGADAIQTNLLTIMTPIAIILVIALGIGAMVNRISWAWCIAAIAGIAVAFGAPQIVTWVRGMFGV
jgi:type IV secretion system protein VirB2